MPTYRIDYPDGTSETTTSDTRVTHAVVVQAGPGKAWETADHYNVRREAADDATYLAEFANLHAVKVVPVTAT